MNRRRTMTVSLFIVSFLALAGGSAEGVIEGLRMVGIGMDPDGAQPDTLESLRGCFWTQTHEPGPGFVLRDISDAAARWDITLLSSNSLQGAWEVSQADVDTLVKALDVERVNYLDVEEKDLQLIVNYLSNTTVYDTTGTYGDWNFEVFPNCDTTVIPLDERGHVDFYLLHPDDHDFGQFPADFVHPLEDLPATPESPEYRWNSFQVKLQRQGELPADKWQRLAASGAAHEVTHMLRASDKDMLGEKPSHCNSDEMFATAGSYLAGGVRGPLGGDVPYSQSIIRHIGMPQCQAPVTPEGDCLDWADKQDCRTGYVNWALWSAYLLDHFREAEYENDLMYKWARVRHPASGKLTKDMCGLARVLSDSTAYGWLGGQGPTAGAWRLCKIFHDHSVAKWVDNAGYRPEFAFNDISPRDDFGLFQKIETGQGQENCWEIPIPPEFLVGSESDGQWRYVPGNASECSEGWNDPRDSLYCSNAYCDPVKVRLWGSYCLGFEADTGYYDAGKSDRYLRVKLDWESGAMNDSTELWVSVLKYSNVGQSLPQSGQYLTHAATQQFGPGDDVTVNVYDFHVNGNEGAALVLSLVPTYFDTVQVPCDGPPPIKQWPFCLPRTTWAPKDLTFSYSFTVLREQIGGGCPFVEPLAADGYIADNNVLAGSGMGQERTDLYVLKVPPVSGAGTYRLRLSEREQERSSFDRVGLLVADVAPGERIAALPGGEIVAYTTAAAPLACSGADGADLLDLVSRDDGERALIPPGGWVDALFPAPGRSGGGIGIDGGPGQKIEPPEGRERAEAGFLDLTPMCYRANECTNLVDATRLDAGADGLAHLRITAPVEFYLDQLFLAEFADTVPELATCTLVSARHSGAGSCLTELAAGDDVAVTLSPGEEIELEFAGPPERLGFDRQFVFVAEGSYEHLSSPGDARGGVPAALRASLNPNPSAGSTALLFDVPAPGGPVSVRVYDLVGRLVKTLGDQELAPGSYELLWDARNDAGERVAAGVYFYRIELGGFAVQRKLVALK